MLKYVTTRFQTHHMSSVLFETGEAFTVTAGNIIRDSFAKTHQIPLIPPNMIKNKQEYVSSIQKSSKGINHIAEDTLAPAKFLTERTNNPMVIIQGKGSIQQQLRKSFSGRQHLTKCESEMSSLFRIQRGNL